MAAGVPGAPIATFFKDPDAKLDYTVDWSEWLATGETLSTSTFTVPAGITKVSESNTATTATVRLSGGTASTNYDVINAVTTSSGNEDHRTIRITVRER